jgi:hypothetical protein
MHFSDRSISPLGQTFGAELTAEQSLSSGSFVPCPEALLQGKSAEQMCELAALYQRAYEQALKSVQKRTVALRRFQFPLDDSLRGIGWN